MKSSPAKKSSEYISQANFLALSKMAEKNIGNILACGLSFVLICGRTQ